MQDDIQSSSQQPTPQREVIIDLVAGSLGGVAAVIVGQPLDTVKVPFSRCWKKNHSFSLRAFF